VNVSIETEDTKSVPNGNVIRTDPEAGTIVSSGSLVTLYVAIDQELRTNKVPNVVGAEDIETAKKAIIAAGMRVGALTYEESHDEEGTIIGQSPEGGKEVAIGTAISLIISEGPPECEYCGSDDHESDDHPRCDICGSRDHRDHPRCPVCNSTEHTSHPTCPVCGSTDHMTHPEQDSTDDSSSDTGSESEDDDDSDSEPETETPIVSE